MQIAAMNPIAVDADSVPADVIAREKDIAVEQVKAEGKPAEMAEKIAMWINLRAYTTCITVLKATNWFPNCS